MSSNSLTTLTSLAIDGDGFKLDGIHPNWTATRLVGANIRDGLLNPSLITPNPTKETAATAAVIGIDCRAAFCTHHSPDPLSSLTEGMGMWPVKIIKESSFSQCSIPSRQGGYKKLEAEAERTGITWTTQCLSLPATQRSQEAVLSLETASGVTPPLP